MVDFVKIYKSMNSTNLKINLLILARKLCSFHALLSKWNNYERTKVDLMGIRNQLTLPEEFY